MSKTYCFDCGKDLLGSGPGSHNPRLCIEELMRVRDATLLQLEAAKAAEGVAVEQHNLADAEARSLKLQNDELKKTLGAAIQYVEHSRICHLINEETLEMRFDETCFKCRALRVYFGPEEGESEKRKCQCGAEGDHNCGYWKGNT